MIRKLLKVLGTLCLLGFVVLSVLGILGYKEYKEALNQVGVEERIEQVRQQEGYVAIDQLPPVYVDAVVAVEDHDFYVHPGIDLEAMGRALMNNIRAMSLVEGGSTITQQLAKNLFFTQEKSFVRKFAEIFMAFDLEHRYSKQEILEVYVNSIYFGDGYYGIENAAQGYFGETVSALNDAQCILLAGIPNAPSVYSLSVSPDLAIQRGVQVLRQMVKYNFMTEEQAGLIQSQLADAALRFHSS